MDGSRYGPCSVYGLMLGAMDASPKCMGGDLGRSPRELSGLLGVAGVAGVVGLLGLLSIGRSSGSIEALSSGKSICPSHWPKSGSFDGLGGLGGLGGGGA